MLWLVIIIVSQFFLAAVTIVDKHLLKERISSPKVYAFYIGVLGILVVVLIPFGFLVIPDISGIALALIAGTFQTLALFALFVGLKRFEASRIIPAIGAILPLFTFGFVFVFAGGKEALSVFDIIAFLLLLFGAFFITWEEKKTIPLKTIKIATLVAMLFAAYFILMKYVYLSQPFLSGLIWIRVGAFIAALFFLFFKEVREDIFKGPSIAKEKTWLIALPSQAVGGGAMILQNWAIALAPFAYLGIVNALEGTKYVFLLIMGVLLSIKFPQILKEELSKKVILQKVIAILFIGAGLALLVF